MMNFLEMYRIVEEEGENKRMAEVRRAEVTKKLVAGGRGREGKEKPAAEP